MSELPGQDLIAAGIAAIMADEVTVEALLVRMVRGRLARADYWTVPCDHEAELAASRDLYDLLGEEYGKDAHHRYNVLLRRALSFCQAVEWERASRMAGGS